MSEVTAGVSTAIADRYRLERELGQGGMVTVNLADDLEHDREVAREVLKPASAGRKAPPGRGAMPSRLERRER